MQSSYEVIARVGNASKFVIIRLWFVLRLWRLYIFYHVTGVVDVVDIGFFYYCFVSVYHTVCICICLGVQSVKLHLKDKQTDKRQNDKRTFPCVCLSFCLLGGD